LELRLRHGLGCEQGITELGDAVSMSAIAIDPSQPSKVREELLRGFVRGVDGWLAGLAWDGFVLPLVEQAESRELPRVEESGEVSTGDIQARERAGHRVGVLTRRRIGDLL